MKQTITVLHPGIETAADVAAAKAARGPQLAPRLSGLKGKRLALLDNGKVNSGAILGAIAKRLQARHGVAEVRAWKKRHAGESGAAVIPDLLRWRPELALTAIGD